MKETFRADETGSLTIFGLFIFMLLVMMSGMAVDMVRQERARVSIQNTIDTAVVAASSLTQEMQSKAEVEALVKDHMAKAGYDPSIVTVDSDFVKPEGSDELTSRYVTADVDFQMDTLFMGFLGIDKLDGVANSGASEGHQMVEISLVLDVSGSMDGIKLTRLQTAARDFVTTVLTNTRPDRTVISIVPYSDQVLMSPDLHTRLTPSFNTDAVIVDLPDDAHPGALASFVPGNTNSYCARFRDDDFETSRLVDGAEIELLGHFSQTDSDSSGTPSSNNRWCKKDDRTAMMLFQNNELTLHTFINSLEARGWTAIDYGMNWGVGLLDPSFQSVATGMIADGFAPASAAGTPVDPAQDGVANDVKKYVVLMTDGINTRQKDLKDGFKSGPTRIWHSATLAGDDTFDTWDGFLVEMPENSASQRYYRPRSPNSGSDHVWVAADDIPADAVQWDHHALFDRFHPNFIGDYFFDDADSEARTAYRNAVNEDLGYANADTRAKAICAAARTTGGIEIYTVAFEAPDEANDLLNECSQGDETGNHFNVVGTDISTAFAAIAAEITKLRLTQ